MTDAERIQDLEARLTQLEKHITDEQLWAFLDRRAYDWSLKKESTLVCERTEKLKQAEARLTQRDQEIADLAKIEDVIDRLKYWQERGNDARVLEVVTLHLSRAYGKASQAESLLASRPPAGEDTTVLQAVLDAINGTLDPHSQIADHPNVKFAQMQRLQVQREAFKAGYHVRWHRDQGAYCFDPAMSPGDPDGAYEAWQEFKAAALPLDRDAS